MKMAASAVKSTVFGRTNMELIGFKSVEISTNITFKILPLHP
jgi:hypothetical protein